MLKAYFDSGGRYADSQFITLAGVVAEDSAWSEIDANWDRILRDRKPRASALHMASAASLNNEFAVSNGWNEQEVEKLVADLLMYLQRVNKRRFRFFAATLDVAAHRDLCSSGYLLDSPEHILNAHCPEIILPWYYRSYPGLFLHGGLLFYFDRGEPYYHPFREKWWGLRRDVAWRAIGDVRHANRTSVGIQIADLCAWAANRQESPSRDRFRYLSHIMRQIIPSSTVVFTEDKLRRRYDLPEKLPRFVFP